MYDDDLDDQLDLDDGTAGTDDGSNLLDQENDLVGGGTGFDDGIGGAFDLPDSVQVPEFDPEQAQIPAVVGDPMEALPYWHVQEQQNSCAVAAQESILDEFTGVDHTEAELREVAEENGWFSPETGTPVADTGKLLDLYGLETHQYSGASIEQLESALAEGDG